MLAALLLILRKVTFGNSLPAKILGVRNLTGFGMELVKFIKDIKQWMCLRDLVPLESRLGLFPRFLSQSTLQTFSL